ncbi:MAG: formate dehydrogenase accessory sulfurtransferase FdhD [Proteobacteria bacterium]|nr:formate dehydrogenase accessory sulfurtransferase FdhD [Pseudomonadota bacterium]
MENRQQQAIAITMRTPGHDEELALGFLFSEGIIQTIDQVLAVGPCGNAELGSAVRVELAEDVKPDLERLQRSFYTTSSCGVCGKQSIAALHTQSHFQIETEGFELAPEVLIGLPDLLRGHDCQPRAVAQPQRLTPRQAGRCRFPVRGAGPVRPVKMGEQPGGRVEPWGRKTDRVDMETPGHAWLRMSTLLLPPKPKALHSI